MNRKLLVSHTIILFFLLAGFVQLQAQTFAITAEKDKIVYHSDARGNQVLDFSVCGYRSSEEAIPHVPYAVFVPYKEGDNSARIQKAIDYVSSLPVDENGFRGAVLLDSGVFELTESLRISTSGVVLQGRLKEGTVLFKKGTDRGALIYIEGRDDRQIVDTIRVSESYVPVNRKEIQVSSTSRLRSGSRLYVVRPSTKEWISQLKCDAFGGGIGALGWKPGDMDLYWDRTVTAISENQITLDVPLTVALDEDYGGGKLLVYQWAGRISSSGVENLTLMSDYNKQYLKDEDHCWTGISIENAENCWVRQVNFKHFAGSAVILQQTASKITVEDCISQAPVSEIGGMRRTTFYTLGQQTLFQRCYSEYGIHDFAAGFCAAGPNAFVQCESKESYGFSGSVDSWACGLLFDIVNIDGHNLTFKNLGQDKNGVGWNTANSLFWQCTAAEIECYTPPGDAVNRTYGCWALFSGDGEWRDANNHIQPRSFFYAQLEDRLGKDVSERALILPMSTSASSSPTIEVAMQLAEEAKKPKLTLEQWINRSPSIANSPASSKQKTIDQIKVDTKSFSTPKQPVEIKDGRLTINGALAVGAKQEVQWWNGKLRNTNIAKSKPHITRFVPGREGLGVTDRIDSVVNFMQQHQILVLDHNYGLWYDRRRDNHERIRCRDGDVWGPFYEQPFSRTNSEKYAWDGMSKYDLTRPNAWYWSRLKEFAEKGAEKGLLLFHQNYFQHNILEAGAHWVDSPWRTANNINQTDFPEPVHFAGDKRIFVAEMFYDVTHPVRRELHRNYIRQCLNNFADNENVVQLISAEFTGPLHFVQFWMDVIAEWQTETGKNATVALSATKDVQDAILNDPKRAAIVDIIDVKYWHYKNDGTVYAPEGGKNLAPRQHARKMKVGKVTFAEAYKAVSEYRRNYPNKAVTYYAQNYPEMAWAVAMAEGSCPVLPVKDKSFLTDISTMKMVETDTNAPYKIVKSDKGCIIYSYSSGNVPVSLSEGKYILKFVNSRNGEVEIVNKNLKINGTYLLQVPNGKTGVYWFCKK